MLPTGEYSSSAAYAALDVVTYNNNLYCCKTAATAGESPSSAPAKWVLMIVSADIEDGGSSGQF
ncbi:carbohydrate-binding protein [Cloacibacillus evryensis]|uniref:carbohydrate-binding protein n=1 Tax=Cloacibacillus evryensis TaxID=508460 RepID=UPI0034650DCF